MDYGCSIIVATYNEVENVENLVNKISSVFLNFEGEFEIIIVDDDSPDGTFDKLLRLSKRHNNLRPIIRRSDRGLAKSIWEGLRAVKYDNIIIMDSDLSHQPSEIPGILEELEKKNLMVWRSRYIFGGQIENSKKNGLQYRLSRIFNYFIMRVLNLPILDTTNGFFGFKKKLLQTRNLKQCFQGYGDFSFLFLFALCSQGVVDKTNVVEIPSTYKQRLAGSSKTRLLKVGLSYSFVAFQAKLLYLINIR